LRRGLVPDTGALERRYTKELTTGRGVAGVPWELDPSDVAIKQSGASMPLSDAMRCPPQPGGGPRGWRRGSEYPPRIFDNTEPGDGLLTAGVPIDPPPLFSATCLRAVKAALLPQFPRLGESVPEMPKLVQEAPEGSSNFHCFGEPGGVSPGVIGLGGISAPVSVMVGHTTLSTE